MKPIAVFATSAVSVPLWAGACLHGGLLPVLFISPEAPLEMEERLGLEVISPEEWFQRSSDFQEPEAIITASPASEEAKSFAGLTSLPLVELFSGEADQLNTVFDQAFPQDRPCAPQVPEAINTDTLKVAVFGAGLGGQRATLALPFFRQMRLKCLIDNNPELHGKTVHGLPVIGPSGLEQHRLDIVFIASAYHLEIRDQMLDLQVPPGKIVSLPAQSIEAMVLAVAEYLKVRHAES